MVLCTLGIYLVTMRPSFKVAIFCARVVEHLMFSVRDLVDITPPNNSRVSKKIDCTLR